jgi:hypothetical protein
MGDAASLAGPGGAAPNADSAAGAWGGQDGDTGMVFVDEFQDLTPADLKVLSMLPFVIEKLWSNPYLPWYSASHGTLSLLMSGPKNLKSSRSVFPVFS